MNSMQASPRPPSVKGQVLTCLLFVALAVTITYTAHAGPPFSMWAGGLSLATQVAVSVAFAALCGGGAAMALRLARLRRLVRMPEALRSVDLGGHRPWTIGLCAGVGEELLFRAALQPLVGLWIGALLFAMAHAKTAWLGTESPIRRVAYLLNVALAGVALGLAFKHLGLVAAVLMHATIDIVALLACRSLSPASVDARNP